MRSPSSSPSVRPANGLSGRPARAPIESTTFGREQASDPALNDATRLILNEFRRYVPINLDSDVDWDNTFFQPNLEQKLFINQVGSQHWCTKVRYSEIHNLYFAGNTGENPVTIATVESAVYSGLLAAQAVVAQNRSAAGQTPVPITALEAYPAPLLFAWKVMLSPYAALAKLWVEADALRKDAMAARTEARRSRGSARRVRIGAERRRGGHRMVENGRIPLSPNHSLATSKGRVATLCADQFVRRFPNSSSRHYRRLRRRVCSTSAQSGAGFLEKRRASVRASSAISSRYVSAFGS